MLPSLLPRVKLRLPGCCCNKDATAASLEHAKLYHDFCIQRLAWAIQENLDLECIRGYIDGYDASNIKKALAWDRIVIDDEAYFPILYFAAERNSPEIIRLLCKAGADPYSYDYAKPEIWGVPVLAYAILSAEYAHSDTTDTVLALLAMGANPEDVPQDMWQDYLEGPRQADSAVTRTSYDFWCTDDIRAALCRNLNLMQRYALWKAGNTDRPTPRMLQCAAAWGMLPLFEVPYHIIGQQHSTLQVQQSILRHRLFDTTTPLVFLFTGPSGHGKTELARRMGNLLSLDIVTVDCTEMKYETDVFGPKAPYHGHEAGTPLNNHLAKWTGQRAVVFLDEYDKTTDDVRKSMLLLFESGDYKDRRNNNQLDCSKIIWVLAANLGVEIITKFWTHALKDRRVEEQRKASFKSLNKELADHIKSKIGSPVTGRITEIIPFFPFNEDEQAVTTYKFMRQLWNKVRAPIATDQKWFPGHLYLNYVDDGRIATALAKESYDPDLGARSLQNAVSRGIQSKVADAFFTQTEEVSDSMNDGPLPNYDIRLVTGSSTVTEIAADCRGVRVIQKRREVIDCGSSESLEAEEL